jgi:hypothetical protein
MIKICNLNPFPTEVSNQLARETLGNSNINEYIWRNALLKSNNSDITESFNIQSNYFIDLLASSYLLNMKSMSLNEKEKMQLGNNLDEILISCLFNLKKCNKANDFDHFFHPYFGNCFRFNSGYNIYKKPVELKKNTHTGPLSGLYLELLLDPIDQNTLFSIHRGYNIIISAQGMDMIIDLSGVLISPGLHYNIHLQRQYTSYPPKPYSNCTYNLHSVDSYSSDLYKKTIQENSLSYSKQVCSSLCYNKEVEETCNCSDPIRLAFNSDKEKCLSLDKIACQLNVYQNFDCQNCDCPELCESVAYSYTISMSDYPTVSYGNSLMKNQMIMKKLNKSNLTFDDIKKHIVAVSIFYNQNLETSVQAQIKTDYISLISSIGGILGLFLGKYNLKFIV